MTDTPTYSATSGTMYPSFDALIQAESHGWVCVGIITKKGTSWPVVYGPYPTKQMALSTSRVLRRKWKLNMSRGILPDNKFSLHVRPAWKEHR